MDFYNKKSKKGFLAYKDNWYLVGGNEAVNSKKLFMESINKFVKSIKEGEIISILPTVQSEDRKDNYSICPSVNVTNYSNVEDLGDYIWSKMQLLLEDCCITKEVVIYFL